MNWITTSEAVVEAERFIKRAKAALDGMNREQQFLYGGNKETAAARRASMDLTRALAKMRKA